MTFQKISKTLSVVVLAVLVITLIISITAKANDAAGITIKLAWGDPFTNPKSQTICMCDDSIDLCLPCYEPVPEQ
jgi:hypothetical protein